MPHETELIATIAIGLSAAIVAGVVAQRFRLPLIVGYLLAGVALVLLPALADTLGGTLPVGGGGSLVQELAVTLGKVALFIAVMLIVGVRIIPWILMRVQRTGSRELFMLAILAAALGIAYGAAEFFGTSFALGAFLAGVVVNESELSHRAAEEALPLRDAFAVLFFISVGMLLDPAFLVQEIDRVLIIVAKALAALVLVRLLGGGVGIGLVVAAGLSQLGEFSFILAEMGQTLDLLPDDGQNLILAGALLSITLNPLVFRAIGAVAARFGVAEPGSGSAGPVSAA